MHTPAPCPTAHKALFLDRDGVVINYIPYLGRPHQVQIPRDAGPALKQWQEAGYLLIIITNQAGIGRGYFSVSDVQAIHHRLAELYRPFGVEFTDIFLCPHHPEDACDCRKPSPQMLFEAAEQYDIDLGQSYFLGDAPSDLHAAIQAGCQPLLVRTGRGQETEAKLAQFSQAIPVFDQVSDTVCLLRAHG
ncbi:HAD family hydrolase [Synechocystis sp. LKSZ1]|uniref:D-glycero-alpha-D-manno-heptose-1,7-bisphosphate 7-phosphatase n=1 Tax=Synechocystis sp. LKSZ1 TaxID=3144951 RepID=UPI00336BC7DA